MRVRKNIRLLQAYTILTNMSFVIPVILPYYRDEMGLDFQDFLIGEACFAAVVVLLEVPTGWISDVWHRKYTLALGALFDMLGYLCLVVGDSLIWAILGQSIIGVGISLISGTNSALLYDTLLDEGRTGEYRRLEGLRGGSGFYSVAAASIAGGFLYTADHHLPLYLSLVTLALAFVMAMMMVEPARHKKRPEKHPVADMVDTARYALHGHADVGIIILFAAMLFCSTKLIMWSQQPYYIAMGLPESLFGILMACGFFLAGFSSQMGHKLDGRVGSVSMMTVAWAVAVTVCVAASLHKGWVSVGLLMVGGSCLYGIAFPRVSEAINARVSSERRATILSTQGLMTSLFFIPVSTMMGWISEGHGVSGALLGITGWLCLAGLCLALLVVKKGRRVMLL